MRYQHENILACLLSHSLTFPNKTAFTVLDNEGSTKDEVTFSGLVSRVNQVIFQLAGRSLKGERALLMYRDPLEFIVAFLACQSLGIIPVPMPYIRGTRQFSRLNNIMEDAGAVALLCSEESVAVIEKALAGNLQLIATRLGTQELTASEPNNIAFIQYTSGSTSTPKGVIVRQASLMHNQEMIREAFGCDADSVIFSWLPFHHDMGLIGNILHAVYTGCSCVMMQPLAFMQTPALWLHAISKYKITHSGGPDFAYKVCVEKIPAGSIPELDLSHWQVAYNGSEPVKERTLERFAEHFRDAGFRKEAFYPCYGLAEATLLVSGLKKESKVRLSNGVVSSGQVAGGMMVKILSPGGVEVNEGEICIAGESVTAGYWNRDNKELFHEVDGIRFLRTGDIGFLDNNELFINGRIKEMLIIRGENYYPHDIELAIAGTADCFEPGGIAVFAADEDIMVVAEIKRVLHTQIDAPVLIDDIRNIVTGICGLMPVDVVLTVPGGIPRTTSGKLQRVLCRQYYKDKTWRVLGSYLTGEQRRAQVVEKGSVREYLLGKLGPDNGTNDLIAMGLDSLRATELINAINKELHIHISIAEVFEDNTLEGLIANIENKLRAGNAADAAKPIPVIPIQEDYPLSNAQKRLWILDQSESGGTAYNVVAGLHLKGALNIPALESAFQLLLQRHESLRTVFREVNGEPRQVVLDGLSLPVLQYDPASEHRSFLHTELTRLRNLRFDLANGPLVSLHLYRIGNQEYALIFALHHIICDASSVSIMIRDLLALYKQPISEPLRVQYKDYASWLNHRLKRLYLAEFWKNNLAGQVEPLMLPLDFARPAERSTAGAIMKFYLEDGLTAGIRQLCKAQQATPFNFFLTTIAVLLSKITGQQAMTLGTPVSGRNHYDLEQQVGMYINTLPLAVQIDWRKSFAALLREVAGNTYRVFQYQDYPFDQIIEDLDLHWEPGRSPVFDVMVGLQDVGAEVLHEEGLELKLLDTYLEDGAVTIQENVSAKFDLHFNFGTGTGGRYYVEIEYSTALFKRETIERFYNLYCHIVSQVISSDTTTVAAIGLATPAEKDLILHQFNNTARTYSSAATIVTLFEEQVSLTPVKTALVFEGRTLTYRELNETANQLAHYLLQHYQVKAGDIIGVKLERSEWMILAIMGVLKAGAAYLPIDPEFPAERIEYILNDSNCKVLIDEEELGRFRNQDQEFSKTNPMIGIQPEDLLYVLYTSGSTGQPKGCMLENRGVINRIEWMWHHYGFNEADVILQKTNFTFDVSVWEIFMPLCKGAKMVLCTRTAAGSPEQLLQLIEKEKISCLHFVPAMLSVFLSYVRDVEDAGDKVRSLRKVMASGEALLPETVAEWYGNFEVPLHNLYGPTEASVDVTCYPTLPYDHIIPIGRPVWNTWIYILDESGNLQPPGISGEICIGGDQVARGYLNKPALTAEKFVADPFHAGKRIYKTGDLGYWLADGNIVFQGRRDDQVKIRGYRIETGEIENTLLRYPGIDAAVVVIGKDHTGDKYLLAYIATGQQVDVAEIKAHLGKSLPSYMVPAHYVVLEQLPLNASGKVDRKRLPAPVFATTSLVAPRNATEEKLLKVWQQVLGREHISVTDDFFELGGHSLKLTKLAGLIHKAFEVKLPFARLFTKRVLSEQADMILAASKAAYTAIPVAKPLTDYPLSSSQKMLWILCQLEAGSMAYNMNGVFELEGALDIPALESAFKRLLDRHEILRTVFVENGDVRQVIKPVIDFKINQVVYQDDVVKNELFRPFDLANGPLLRASLARVAPDKWILIYSMHHIISDGWSMGVLIKELLQYYEGEELTQARLQYKDYAVWQQEQLHNGAFDAHKGYWLEQLKGELPVLELPTDFARPLVKTYRGSKMKGSLPMEGIKKTCEENGATLFMGLLSTINILLYRYTGQDDLVVGYPVAGREHADLEDQIGFYVNTLPLRTKVKEDDSFVALLAAIRSNTTAAYEHQAFPLYELINALHLSRDMSRNPLFNVMVVLQNTDTGRLTERAFDGLQVKEYEAETVWHSKYDLTFTFEEVNAKLLVEIEYNTDLYLPRTIERLMEHLQNLLAAIAKGPSVPLWQLDYLGEIEKRQLLLSADATYPSSETIVSLFEKAVLTAGNRVALSFGNVSLTYHELNKRANQLASYLRKQFVINPDDLVAIKLERSERMIIAIMGVLKSGAAYVPVDPLYPEDRINYIISDSASRVIIDEALLELALEETDIENPVCVNKPGDLAYVIYTSGTTGYPKGTLIEHRNVVRLFMTDPALYDFSEQDVWTVFHSYCFDFSVWEIFGALLFGGKLVVVPAETTRDPDAYLDLLRCEKVTVLNQTPSSFYNLSAREMEREDSALSLRYVIYGGEALAPAKLAAWKEKYPATKLINMYGITETTVHVTYKEITALEISSNKSNIGKPIPTLRCYVLDAHQQLVPFGVSGELYVSGDGVARGYLNRDELNRQRFIADPFLQGERMYRSGDKAKVLKNGEMEYEGRFDDQVKIRGFRIETGEIENALRQIPSIKDAVVLAREGQLIAYLISELAVDVQVLRHSLAQQLPAYMLPAYYIQVDHFPVTVNGKLNKKALPLPEDAAINAGTTYVAPRNEVEYRMVKIWEALLGKQKIGVTDSFFELGGDSIRVLKMISEVDKHLGFRVPVAVAYTHHTIADLVAYAAENGAEWKLVAIQQEAEREELIREFTSLKQSYLLLPHVQEKENIEDVFPTSDIERGMLFESLVSEEAGVYHDQFVYRQHYPDFDLKRLERALGMLVAQHEILRTSFNLTDHAAGLQIVHKDIKYSIGWIDTPAISPEIFIQQYLEDALHTPFDLSVAPLWRLDIINLGNDDYGIIWQFHHAILDGWSNAAFITALNNLYFKQGTGFVLPKPRATYKDFIVQQRIDAKNSRAREFWKEELDGYSRLGILTEEDEHSAYLYSSDAAYLQRIEAAATAARVNVKVLSLSAYLYLLHILNEGKEVLAGLVTHIRPANEDGDQVLGCFLNSIPLRMGVKGDETVGQFIEEVNNKLIQLKNYESVSLLEIATLNNTRKEGANPFFDVLFNYIDFHVFRDLEHGTAVPDSLQNNLLAGRERTNTHFDFTVNLTAGVFAIEIQLRKKLAAGLSAARLAALYFSILDHIVDNPGLPLCKAELVGDEERRLLLEEYNNTSAPVSAGLTIPLLFEEAVRHSAGKTALVFEQEELTYEVLNERANRLAHYLRHKYSIVPDDLVGVMLPRTDWMVVTLLGILKSGAAYVPVDIEYPADRIRYILDNSKCRLVIDEEELACFLIEQEEYSSENPLPLSSPENLAYVIYTSGSTGYPKGVMIEHKSVCTFLDWCGTEFGQSDFDVVFCTTSICFDLSVFEIFYSLSAGKMIRVLRNALSIPQHLSADSKILLNTVPSVVGALLREGIDLSAVTVLNMAGEPIPSQYIAPLYNGDREIRNLYGPSEDTTYSTVYRFREDLVVTIGRPIANTAIYILGANNELLPAGVSGEICISSDSLARGYLQDPVLTAAKFVQHPFIANKRMYRTGDLGRWLPSGNIAFGGRKDDQVKVRGFRIEPGEIENALRSYPGIITAAVIPVVHKEVELAAYITGSEPLSTAAIRAHLAEFLPLYMLPAHIIQLDELPLTPNGKLDRKALLAKGNPVSRTRATVTPRNEYEERIALACQEIFDVPVIGVTDNFFDMGGHSLKIAQLISWVNREYGVKLNMKSILNTPTIEDVAEQIAFRQSQLQQQSQRDQLTRIEI